MLHIPPRLYNVVALILTCVAGSIAGTIAVKLGADTVYVFSTIALVGYGFGRFLMPLK